MRRSFDPLLTLRQTYRQTVLPSGCLVMGYNCFAIGYLHYSYNIMWVFNHRRNSSVILCVSSSDRLFDGELPELHASTLAGIKDCVVCISLLFPRLH